MRRFAFVLMFCLILTACAPALSVEGAAERARAGVSLPAGVWYEDGAAPWEIACLPDALRPVFFGEEGEAGIKYRLFLGNDGDCLTEILVAVCETEARAVSLAEQLAVRLSEIQKTGEAAYAPSLKEAGVRRKGRAVAYAAAPNAEKILSLLL